MEMKNETDRRDTYFVGTDKELYQWLIDSGIIGKDERTTDVVIHTPASGFAYAEVTKLVTLKVLDTPFPGMMALLHIDTGGMDRKEWIGKNGATHGSSYSTGIPDIRPLPCGEELPYSVLDQIPLEDVRCPCGNKNHWLVKWAT